MSFDFDDVWKFWFEAQIMEQMNHRQRYTEEKPTLFPADPFDPEKDAEILRAAMKGIGTTEEDIIEVLTKRSVDQRVTIQEKYQQMHGRNLAKDLKSELSGVFEKVILALLKPLPLFYADQLKYATKGAGTDETTLIEIFCTRDTEFIKTIKETFEKEYDIPIEKVVQRETSGNFEKLMMSILACCRDDTASSPSEVAEELCAEEIDEDKMRQIVTSYTLPFLKSVFEEYLEKTGEDFSTLVDSKCSGDTTKAFKAIYESSKNRAEFFAIALNDAVEGYGTDDIALIRIFVSRCEIDLATIKEKYEQKYEKDLKDVISQEVSGDYGRSLLNLMGCYD